MSIIETPLRDPGPAAQVDSAHSLVVYTADDGGITTISGRPGDSIMETAVRNGVPGIVGECGGSLSCASCHVYVDEAWFDRVGGPRSEDEAELLEGG